MKSPNKFILLCSLIFTITILLFSGCESVNNSPESGSLLVKVTDAPFPIDFVESATIIIDTIEIRQKAESNDDPFFVISKIPFEFDLLDLRNGITSDLPEIEIPVGSYDLVRLHVESATVVLKEGLGEFNLKVPSGNQTGFKIFIKPEIQIQGGLTVELLLDFDLSKSFVVRGNPNKPASINGFNFKPVIRAVNNSLAGSIYGTVSDENRVLEGVFVTVSLDEESATALTDENGYYEILGIKEGTYPVSAVLDGYVGGEVSCVVVTANEKTEQNFVLVK